MDHRHTTRTILTTPRRLAGTAALAALILAAGCKLEAASRSDTLARIATPGEGARGEAVTWNPGAWRPPTIDAAPRDSFGAAVRRGLAILTHTRDSLPGYVGANLSCTSCHLDAGTRPDAARLAGVRARYPKYMDRSDVVATLADRVNYCFTRSLAGRRLPDDSREMHDILAYLTYISKGVPMGEHVPGEGMPAMRPLPADSARGRAVFVASCARCHGSDGAGTAIAPALWGAKSFSIGASMARVERAASFVRHNMPFDRPGTLGDQQAWDVAAYVTSMPRPDSPGKERDWPDGGAPDDVPYATKGHAAYHPPRILPRHGDDATVPPPRRAGRAASGSR